MVCVYNRFLFLGPVTLCQRKAPYAESEGSHDERSKRPPPRSLFGVKLVIRVDLLGSSVSVRAASAAHASTFLLKSE